MGWESDSATAIRSLVVVVANQKEERVEVVIIIVDSIERNMATP